MKISEVIDKITKRELHATLYQTLYGPNCNAEAQDSRYKRICEKHLELFGDVDCSIFSAPGRTELSGNHTDHNFGKVLAASVQLDTLAVASPSQNMVVSFHSEGFPKPFIVDLSSLDPKDDEKETTESLIRGVAACFSKRGLRIGGFNAACSSQVRPGSGLSSSASVEVLIGAIFNEMFNSSALSTVEIAKIGQIAENRYFGKPSGLMDQVACAHGGIVEIDFGKKDHPEISPVDYDFNTRGYSLLVVATGGSHEGLGEDYASVPAEMKAVARVLGADCLADTSLPTLLENINKIKSSVSDRALLRALHFFNENKRVSAQVACLKEDRMEDFLKLVTESGNSSFRFLQNVFSSHVPGQPVSLALALTEQFLQGKGASRVHGGGFAGTIQVYVPNIDVADYVAFMTPLLGADSVTPLWIRHLPCQKVL